MSRLVRAGQTLDNEVSALQSKAKMKVVGEPDGFGRSRTISYDAATTRWLLPILDALRDERIASVEEVGKQTHITFVPDARADRDQSYGLADIDQVLNGE